VKIPDPQLIRASLCAPGIVASACVGISSLGLPAPALATRGLSSPGLSGPAAAAAEPAKPEATFAALAGHVVLENERVLVEDFVIPPGGATGHHSHPADQLLVFIKGGVLEAAGGRRTLWRDGRVAWQAGGSPADGGSVNVGTMPIEIVCVTLRPVAPPAGMSVAAGLASAAGAASASGVSAADAPAAGAPKEPTYRHLNYPNIPGEDLLENESVIVQRFTVNPGQWEGVHAHHPNMLYIHIKGGQWAARSKQEPEHAYPPSPDGEVGWMPTIDIGQGHESHNIGKDPIDLIWVTLKK
jgi:predicted metal-dependent enzyme (double-stranded beta helix superfamily)